MGTWSGEPLGNDAAADFAHDLDGQKRWTVVEDALARVTGDGADLDSDVATVAIAAAEVVAHGLGRPTQTDAYTEAITHFVARARRPNGRLTQDAARAVRAAMHEQGELAELWAEDEPGEWQDATKRLLAALEAR